MRLPDDAHTSRPWRIHELTGDFQLEDVWALPTPGGPHDFPLLVEQFASFGRADASLASRVLFAIRSRVGALLGWDDPDQALGKRVPSLSGRLPDDVRSAPPAPGGSGLPFTPLYQLEDEWAAEVANRTVHAVIHLGWVPDRRGSYRGQMAILVKPEGRLGSAYMAAIKPFRHLIVYPSMLRAIGRGWRNERPAGQDGPSAGATS